jgi:hypothetical protein
MKKFLFLPMLLIASFCFSQDAKEIIGKPIKIGNLLVAENDFSEYMNFEDGKKACRALGKGWRLPSISELNIIYKKQEKFNTYFNEEYPYWSSSGRPYFQWAPVAEGTRGIYLKSNEYSIRAVRTQ